MSFIDMLNQLGDQRGNYSAHFTQNTASTLSDTDFFNSVQKPTDKDLREAWRQAIRKYGLQYDTPDVPVIDDTLVPKETAESKRAYDEINNHAIYGARIYGNPGSGLNDSSFGERQIKTGIKGESVFAKLLSWDNILNHCVSFWSVYKPDAAGNRNAMGADIDCILKFGNHILMVDVKNYRSGLDYHTLIPNKAMFCTYKKARVVAHDEYIFSANMAFAQRDMTNYLQENHSHCTVESFVVLVPSSVGQATLDSDICWPTGIPAMSYSSFIDMLKERALHDNSYLNFDSTQTPEEGFLASLVKSYGDIPINTLNKNMSSFSWPKPTYDELRGIKPKQPQKSQKNWQKYHSNKRYTTQSDNATTDTCSSNANTQTQQQHVNQQKTQQPCQEYTKPVTMGRDCSLQLLKDEHNNSDVLSFAHVSGFLAAGWQGSGMVFAMSSIIGTLVRIPNINVHIIDCNSSSCFEQYEDEAASYTRLMDGSDLVSGCIQSMYTSLISRELSRRKHGIGFWDTQDHQGLKLKILYINECSYLFNPKLKTKRLSNDDEQNISDSLRYMRHILTKGVENGMCIMMATQKPSFASLPATLVDSCQIRACFKVPSQTLAKTVLRDAYTDRLIPVETLRIGESLLHTPQHSLQRVTFNLPTRNS